MKGGGMLIIYGADLSSPSNKVRFVAHYIGSEYEYVRKKIKDGETRKAEYLKMHPAGKIPVIDDEGFILFESNAICKYLCEKSGSDLYPQDLKQRAIVDQWMDFVSMHVGSAINKVVFNRVFAPVIPVEVDERSMQDGLNFLNRFLPVVDNQLKDHPYMAGERLSLADINLLATVDPVEIAQIDLSPYPHLLQRRKELQQEDFYTRCHTAYGEKYKHFLASMRKQ